MAASYSSLVGLAVGGKYEIRRVLGAGGMGVVCEAVHLDLGKRVAVKLIDKSMKESELIVLRFRREARAAGQIDSEHIVDVFDVGADKRVGLYMVMEYLTGEDLQGRLERDQRLETRTVVMIAHQIARGLVKAHAAGVIHRDLKPANVYLTERDNGQMLVKLLDFGVSKLLSEAPGSARITGTGAPIGTPLYMSPEQAEGKDDVDGRADIWSLGALMYEALAGAAPFPDRGSYHNTIVGILTSRPKLLNVVAPWVPPKLASVVDAMLVHDREARLQTAEIVAQRLLDAFPTVLPDGTGKHTAVIVPQSAGSVDTTGDTEVFSASSIPSVRFTSGGTARRPSYPPPAPTAQDSARTLTESETTGPGSGRFGSSPPPSGAQTGAASPVDVSRYRAPDFRNTPSSLGGGPKTAPLPPSGIPPISSSPGHVAGSSGGYTPIPTTGPNASGSYTPVSAREDVTGPRTLPTIEAPAVDSASRTSATVSRDAVSDSRPLITAVIVGIIIVVVGIGAFVAGRRVSTPAPPSPRASEPSADSHGPTAAAPSSQATTTPSISAVASISAQTASTAPPVAPSSSVASAPSASASARPVRRPRKVVGKPVSTETPPTPETESPEAPRPFEN